MATPSCPACSGGGIRYFTHDSWLEQDYSFIDLEGQHFDLCDACNFRYALGKAYLANKFLRSNLKLARIVGDSNYRSESRPAIAWEFEQGIAQPSTWTNLILFPLDRDFPEPFPSIPERHYNYGVNISEADLDKAKEWLKLCETDHHCSTRRAITRLPARVIDVRPTTVKLHEPSEDERAPYLCLSHCWGDIRPACRTTSATLKANLQAISPDDLPATFRDAISVTRQLGFDYLWIDSICIIQDSEADWRHQSAEMINIYENAHLTLCASGAVDDEGGLFGEWPANGAKPHH
ncbi:heterokaryon incompatibility protein-domain-containing protein [Podospora australis]|uniref:Heterokaryon incompatibility protein-domain-containing protein n=1 Tax=Podospora australis TaxID=1536484 RepID=A0AAN7AK98_9PEZI|nr:heterokaryon incompatibility protein-domain-containing protein [Podospora australis]